MMLYQFVRLVTVVGLMITSGWLLPVDTFAAATITVVNQDGGNEGFNDSTPFTPIGGNTGTTLGEARLQAFEYAAFIWGDLLTSSVEIHVDAAMDPLGSGILGQAGPTTVHRNFSNTPVANTWYVQALANKFAGMDLDPSTSDMSATFSSDFPFYFGLDGNPPSGQYDFVTVVLHELSHGLGFLSLVNPLTGAKFSGVDDVYSDHVEEHGAIPADFPTMTDAQRVHASTSETNLHFTGTEVVANSSGLTAGKHSGSGHVELYAPVNPSSGSSVSHFNKIVKPDQLMEHSISSGEAIHGVGLAGELLADLGWDVSLGPTVTSPSVHSTLTGSTVTFEWTANDRSVTKWWLYVGSQIGVGDIFNSGDLGTDTSLVVPGLPTDGRTLYVRLWYQIDGLWNFTDVQYTAATVVLPIITSPTPGSTLTTSSVTFQWRANAQAVTRWWLYVGSQVGANDIYNSGGLDANISPPVTGLPTRGQTVYVRLWYQIEGLWQFTDEQYTAATLVAPMITTPVPGSTMESSNAVFLWTANEQPVTRWWFYVGSQVGAQDIYNSGDLGTDTVLFVPGLPTDGRTLYVRLWYQSSGVWQIADLQYTALHN